MEALTAPDLTDPVLGVRAWRVESGVLCSTFSNRPWHLGVNQAECLDLETFEPRPDAHRAPAARCRCGIYGLHNFNSRYRYWFDDDGWPAVIGAVAAWGQMQIHPSGFRAEYAQILALSVPPSLAEEARGTAQRYRVPLVDPNELEAVALAHARPLPQALLPLQRPVVVVIDCRRTKRVVSLPKLRAGVQNLVLELDHPALRPALVTCGSEASAIDVDADRYGDAWIALDCLVASGEHSALADGLRRARGIAAFARTTLPTAAILIVGSQLDDLPRLAAEAKRCIDDGLDLTVIAPPALAQELGAAIPRASVAALDPSDPETYERLGAQLASRLAPPELGRAVRRLRGTG